MEHDQALDKLDEWIDGELGADESAALSRHLDACDACRREAATRKRLGEALFSPVPAQDPRRTEAFVRRVMARVEEESVPLWRRAFGRVLTPALGLGLAALLLSILRPGLGSASAFEGWEQPEPPALVEVP